MYPTAEIRWFLAGDIPGSAAHWFRAIGERNHLHESRVDRYLRLPNAKALGVKLRDDRIEIKSRTETLGKLVISSDIEGQLECWCKWSFPLADADDQAELIDGADRYWVSVGKDRVLKRFLVSDQGDVEPVPPDYRGPRTCALELARVNALGQTWWSLAIEASGNDARSKSGLVIVARELFGSSHPFTFTASDSLSYPLWLRGIPTWDEAEAIGANA